MKGLRVQVVYATPAEQAVIDVQLPAGATVGDAIRACGILARFSEIDLMQVAVGIFGERAGLGDPVREGDRVEIYRELQVDPKQARRRRARKRG